MLYQFFILLYQLIIKILKTYPLYKLERDFHLDLSFLPVKKRQRIWFHCASAGEFEQCMPFIQKIKNNLDVEIVISFYSPSGMIYHDLHPIAHHTFFLPIDTKQNAKALLDQLQPDYVIWVKYEFWQNILNEIFERKIPCDLLFADLAQLETTHVWERNRRIRLIKRFTGVFSISDIKKYHIQYHLISDGKWSKSLENASHEFKEPSLEDIYHSKKVLLLGSAHLSDINILSDYLEKYSSDFHWIIVPHEIDEEHIEKMKKMIPISKLENQCTFITEMGILKYLYRYAHIAWVGGGWDKSVHNVLEAVAYGIPVISGPNIKRIHETKVLKDAKVLFTIDTADSLSITLEKINKVSPEFWKTTIQEIYTKNAVDDYSIYILNEMTKKLS